MKTKSPKSPGCVQDLRAEICAISREKYWSEIDDKEKIRRLRNVVKQLQQAHDRLVGVASKALKIAEAHEHGSAGQVVINARDDRTLGMYDDVTRSKYGSGDDVYF